MNHPVYNFSRIHQRKYEGFLLRTDLKHNLEQITKCERRTVEVPNRPLNGNTDLMYANIDSLYSSSGTTGRLCFRGNQTNVSRAGSRLTAESICRLT